MNFEAIGPDCVSRSEENVRSYFKAGGWSSCPQPATHKDKRAHLGRGLCPNKPRDTSGAAFRLKRKTDKGSPMRLRRGAHTTPVGLGGPYTHTRAHKCERTCTGMHADTHTGTHNSLATHQHTHTRSLSALLLMNIHPHSPIHTRTPTQTPVHAHLHTQCTHTQAHSHTTPHT